MISGLDTFSDAFGNIPPGDTDRLAQVARLAVKWGYRLVLCHPGTKEPLCPLTARQAKTADAEAQERGRRRHLCGAHHVFDDPAKVFATIKRLKGEVNLGIALAASRLLVVDTDTAEEKQAFLDAWAEHDPKAESYTPTVLTPGKKKVQADGTEKWIHKDGGHFWFRLPDDLDLSDLPVGTWKAEKGGWVAMWGPGKMALVPPSSREEGNYVLTGQLRELPDWLTKIVRDAGEARKRKRDDVEYDEDDPITQWSEATPWSQILTEDGWTDTGEVDTCGCSLWTAPGDHASPKSATAHERHCLDFDGAFLHIWTTHPPDFLADAGANVSKLQYVTYRDHEGDFREAMATLELPNGRTLLNASKGTPKDNDPDDPFGLADRLGLPKKNSTADDDKPPAKSQTPDAEDFLDRLVPLDWPSLFTAERVLRWLPAKLGEYGHQIAFVSEGKTGKSLFMLDWCWHVAMGEQFLGDDVEHEPLSVLYLDRENNEFEIRDRLRSFGAEPDDLENLHYYSFPPMPSLDTGDGALWVMELVKRHKADVVILDTVSRFIQGKENESDTWLALYRKFHQRLKAHGVTGIRVDHFGKDTNLGARGSSAKHQDVDHVWELKVYPAQESGDEVIEVRSEMDLIRTHTRTGIGPDRMPLTRIGQKNPLSGWLPRGTSHTLSDEPRASSRPKSKTDQAEVAILDAGGLEELAAQGYDTVRALADYLNMERNAVHRAVKRLKEGVFS